VDDTLAIWNTAGLEAGQYVLLLTIFHNFGDSIPLISSARLEELISDVKDEYPNVASSFMLAQNYPNPFNPTTTIRFTIPAVERFAESLKNNERIGNSLYNVQLKVYDVLGNEVAVLVNEEKTAGSYETDFEGDGFTSGIYFYQLSAAGGAGNFIETKKMILMK